MAHHTTTFKLPSGDEQFPKSTGSIPEKSLPVLSQNQSPPTDEVVIAPRSIGWRQPASMLSLLLIAIGCAIGHHMFYESKNGKQARNQQWTIRIGTSFAYLLAFSLSALGGISRDQWVWRTLRTRFLTLGGIDAMFGVTSSIFCFFNCDILRKAKISTAMAAVRWLFPLVTIFTPSTISVVSTTRNTSAPCIVPSLDFRPSQDDVWYLGDALYLSVGDYYSGPDPKAFALFSVPSFSGQVTVGSVEPFKSPLCGLGASGCAYTIQFEGPAINCTETPLDNPDALWAGDYDFSQCKSPSPSASSYMPVFQANTSDSSNTLWALASVRGIPGARAACREIHGYRCQASVANYTVRQTIDSSQFRQPNITANILYPIPDSRDGSDYIPNWVHFDVLMQLLGGAEYLVIKPDSVEAASIKVTGTGSGLGSNKELPNGSSIELEATRVEGTPLMDSSYDPIHPLGPAIEIMAQKMTVSLLSSPYTSYYINTTVTCVSTEAITIYKYNGLILIITYTTVISVSCLLGVLGTLALIWNGVASDVSFSTILRTTRNPTLDRELKGAGLGGGPLPGKFEKLKLRFGALTASRDDGAPGVCRAAMGTEGEVEPIRKNEQYY